MKRSENIVNYCRVVVFIGIAFVFGVASPMVQGGTIVVEGRISAPHEPFTSKEDSSGNAPKSDHDSVYLHLINIPQFAPGGVSPRKVAGNSGEGGSVVPKAATYAMMLGGLGMLIAFQRSRRRHRGVVRRRVRRELVFEL